jgi:hypothetical protein
MTLRYRTTGAWGTGLGVNLTAAQVDENFHTLDQAIDAVPAGEAGVGISNITVVGTSITFHLTDATTLGPFTIPTPRVPAVVTVSTLSHDLTADDVNKYHRCTNAAGCSVVVPDDAVLDVPVGSEYHFRSATVGVVSFGVASGATINGVTGYLNATSVQGATVTLKKVAADSWDIFGLLDVDVSA